MMKKQYIQEKKKKIFILQLFKYFWNEWQCFHEFLSWFQVQFLIEIIFSIFDKINTCSEVLFLITLETCLATH